MLHLQGICATFFLGQTVLMLVTLYKFHDSTDIRTLASHTGILFLLFDAFSPFIICISHLILDYLVMHLLWNHCRSTSFYPNCMFITRHYSLASSLYPSIMHYYHLPFQSVPVPSRGCSPC
jgi:hypothetical protein